MVVGEPATIDVQTAAGRTDIANARRFIAEHGQKSGIGLTLGSSGLCGTDGETLGNGFTTTD